MHTVVSATSGWRDTPPRVRVLMREFQSTLNRYARKRVSPLHSCIELVGDQVFDRLTFANECDLVSADQCLRR
jgi:hypothetical protein